MEFQSRCSLSQGNSSIKLHLQRASTFHEYSPVWIERITSWVVCSKYPCSSSEVFSPATQLCICCVLLKVLPQVVLFTCPSSVKPFALPVGLCPAWLVLSSLDSAVQVSCVS